MDDHTTITLDIQPGWATLTLARPDQRNGMTNRMVRETYEALSLIASRDDIRLLLLTGAGRSFCPGADLNQIGQPMADPLESCASTHFQVPRLLHEMPQLTIAAINGACAGAGMGWACGCDLRIAARSAMFNTAFLNVAVAGDMGLPWSLPRLVGAARAKTWSFFSEKFDAQEALSSGLVSRIFDDDSFSEDTRALIDTFLARSPTALTMMKAHYLAAESMSFNAFIDLETERHHWIATHPHAAEAFKAFIEKRPANFQEV